MPRSAAARLWPLAALLWTIACAEPPTREINQAQGAIDAARAAGADRYAVDEFKAAESALARAHAASAERDFRQALSLALDARERARNAAREASTRMAQLVSEAALDVQDAARQLEAARKAAASPATGREARARKTALADAEKRLQEARSAMAAGEYEKARAAANAVRARIASLVSGERTAGAPRTRSSPRR